MELNYNDDVQIDESALDVEWLDQASLALRYGKNWAQCMRKFTEAEEKVKVVRAELIAEANENPIKCCKKDKPNAADIEAYYRNHRKHKMAKEEWIEAQYELNMAEIAKNEICYTRKTALENLGRLFGLQYFAGPKMPRDLIEEKQRKIDSNVAQKIQRKRTK